MDMALRQQTAHGTKLGAVQGGKLAGALHSDMLHCQGSIDAFDWMLRESWVEALSAKL